MNHKVQVWTAPSTRSCLKNAIQQTGDSNSYILDAAKGEFVSMQILIRNTVDLKDDDDAMGHIVNISGVKVSKTSGSDFDVSSVRVQAQEYISFADATNYPDAIANSVVAEILANTTQGMWVTFPIPAKQEAGEYKFHIEFETNFESEISADVTLNIFNVEIPPSNCGKYSVEHFTTPEAQIILDHSGYNCKAFDDKWWQFMEAYAKSLCECRSNVYRVNPLPLLSGAGSRRVAKDKWEFDFSIFDKMVKLLTETGVAKKFATDDMLAPWADHDIYALDENGEIIKIDISEPEADIWAKEFFTALYEHIIQNSKAEDWIIHIQDEPQNADIWLWARERIRKYMPGLKCGNPLCADNIRQLGDNVELYIPVFWAVEQEPEFYQSLLGNPDKEVWSYCCCSPAQSWYLNRFIDRPAIQSRLIAWSTYSQGFTGFLHYGYSYWQKTSQFYPFGIEKYSQYKGDCMLIYPSPEDNSYKISIRYINIRDGAQDYELMKIAEKADSKKVRELSKGIASRYTEFDMDEKKFQNARHKLLVLAESGQKKLSV